MTETEYYDGVRALGLKHAFNDLFRTVNGEPVWVQPPQNLSEDARIENLVRLRKRVQNEF